MGTTVSSAEPRALLAYADRGDELDQELITAAATLEHALQRYAATCTEYRTSAGPALAHELRGYAERTSSLSETARRVAIEFLLADAGGIWGFGGGLGAIGVGTGLGGALGATTNQAGAKMPWWLDPAKDLTGKLKLVRGNYNDLKYLADLRHSLTTLGTRDFRRLAGLPMGPPTGLKGSRAAQVARLTRRSASGALLGDALELPPRSPGSSLSAHARAVAKSNARAVASKSLIVAGIGLSAVENFHTYKDDKLKAAAATGYDVALGVAATAGGTALGGALGGLVGGPVGAAVGGRIGGFLGGQAATMFSNSQLGKNVKQAVVGGVVDGGRELVGKLPWVD